MFFVVLALYSVDVKGSGFIMSDDWNTVIVAVIVKLNVI